MIHIKRMLAGFLFFVIILLIIAPGVMFEVTRDARWFMLYIPHVCVISYVIGMTIFLSKGKTNEKRAG